MNQWNVKKQTKKERVLRTRAGAACGPSVGAAPQTPQKQQQKQNLSDKGGAVEGLWLLTKSLGNRAEMPSEQANAASTCHHDQILKENRL